MGNFLPNKTNAAGKHQCQTFLAAVIAQKPLTLEKTSLQRTMASELTECKNPTIVKGNTLRIDTAGGWADFFAGVNDDQEFIHRTQYMANDNADDDLKLFTTRFELLPVAPVIGR